MTEAEAVNDRLTIHPAIISPANPALCERDIPAVRAGADPGQIAEHRVIHCHYIIAKRSNLLAKPLWTADLTAAQHSRYAHP